jgi:hypothetical protein
LQVFLKVFNEHLGYCGDHPRSPIWSDSSTIRVNSKRSSML